jgi:hypothetical protein
MPAKLRILSRIATLVFAAALASSASATESKPSPQAEFFKGKTVRLVNGEPREADMTFIPECSRPG